MICLVLEYELSSVAAILCVIVRPERTPQENLFGGRSGHMAEDQAAGVPPAAETTILALAGAGRSAWHGDGSGRGRTPSGDRGSGRGAGGRGTCATGTG